MVRTSERLTTGFRINSASDDAAGLGISEKMRAQTRSLAQAERNTQDGISLIQTAEGALGTMHDILRRMRELALQSMNGVYVDDDRIRLQDEFSQLMAELDDIAARTHFNTRTLLDGGRLQNSYEWINDDVWLWGTPTTPPLGNVTDWANVNGVNMQALADTMADIWAPAIINAIMETLPFLAALGFDANMGLEVGIYHDDPPPQFSWASAWARMGLNAQNNTMSLAMGFSRDFLASVTDGTGSLTPQGAVALQGILAHEIGHIVMMSTMSFGHLGGHPAADEFPLWWVEGAQLFSGHMGWMPPGTTEAQVRANLSELGSYSGIDRYANSWVIMTYLSSLASGGGTANLADGMNTIFSRVANGESVESVVVDLTGFASLTAFEDAVRAGDNDVVNFAMQALAAKGNGFGSLILPGGLGNSSWASLAPGNRDNLFLNVINTQPAVINTFPPGMSVLNGGGRTQDTGWAANNTGLGRPPFYTGHLDIGDGVPPTPVPIPSRPPQLSFVRQLVQIEERREAPTLMFQIGANSNIGSRIFLQLLAMSSRDIGMRRDDDDEEGGIIALSGTGINTIARAANSLDIIDGAISMVSQHRSRLGAIQNRLEWTAENLNIAYENLSATNSRIRDADMAQESMRFTQHNILQQSTMSMLAQANQQPQVVLQLLG